MKRTDLNCETGELRELDLTEDEIAEIEAAKPEEPPTPPAPLTARERLEAAGFNIAELGDD
jgi:hypothetical protein